MEASLNRCFYKQKGLTIYKETTMENKKFRGLVKENKQGNELDWHYGDLVRELSTGKTFILDLSHFNKNTTLHEVLVEVEPKTVGQYTGLKDKNGKEIYEGDIFNVGNNAVVSFEEGEFILRYDNGNAEEMDMPIKYHADRFEVIGNIYENKELLE